MNANEAFFLSWDRNSGQLARLERPCCHGLVGTEAAIRIGQIVGEVVYHYLFQSVFKNVTEDCLLSSSTKFQTRLRELIDEKNGPTRLERRMRNSCLARRTRQAARVYTGCRGRRSAAPPLPRASPPRRPSRSPWPLRLKIRGGKKTVSFRCLHLVSESSTDSPTGK